MKYKLAFTVSTVLLASPCFANCSDVLKLSMQSTNVLLSESDFLADVSSICKSEELGRNGERGGGIGIPGVLEIGGKAATRTAIKNTFCSESDSAAAKSNAYQLYVRSIARGAYPSYEACLRSDRSLQVEIGASTPTFVPITVSFKPQAKGEEATIAVQTDPSISCDLENPVVLNDVQNVQFSCKRDVATSLGSITVTNLTGPGSLSVPWQAFTANDGVPVNLAAELSAATSEIQGLKASLSDAVIGFAAKECPDGFLPYMPAQGRFLRGIDQNGENDAAAREPGSFQEDMFKSHQHNSAVSENRTGWPNGSGDTGRSSKHNESYWRGNRGLSDKFSYPTSAVGGSETRPKNVAVLFCRLDE
jgi:hypothetical protein